VDFNWELFLNVLIIGVANGAVIALIALGYTLVYGIVELINFAHGDVFTMGAYMAMSIVGATAVTNENSTFAIIGVALLALVGAMLFSSLINFSIDRFAYRRLRKAPRLAPLIAAIGFSFIFQQIAIYWHGSNPVSPPQLIPIEFRNFNILSGVFDGKVRLKPMDVAVVLITIPLLLGLSWFVQKTRTGKAMRATAQDREASQLMGVDVNRTISYAFILGGLLAGAAGFIALFYYNTARPSMGFRYGLFAFTAAVLGGIGNLNGAVLGGFLIGLVAAISDGFLQQYVDWWGAQWTPALIFGLLVLTLVFKPGGLLGEQTPDKV